MARVFKLAALVPLLFGHWAAAGRLAHKSSPFSVKEARSGADSPSCELRDITIGLSLDTSSSISGILPPPPGAFQVMTAAVAAFIRDVSGAEGTANNITFYVNFFDAGIRRRSAVATNADDQQALFVEAPRVVAESASGTDVALGLIDQLSQLQRADLTSRPVLTKGTSRDEAALKVPWALTLGLGIATRLREAGFTLITVAIGRRVERELLSSIASTSPGGEPLFFEIDEFDQIKEALIDIFVKSADTDGDGTPDCEDACPVDADKTIAGFCGCGEQDTFPCPGDLLKTGKEFKKKKKAGPGRNQYGFRRGKKHVGKLRDGGKNKRSSKRPGNSAEK